MAGKHIIKAKKYKVQDGDSIESLANSAGITWKELARFNWGTDDPDEINKYLGGLVGCTKKTKDGKNYIFTSKDDPGIVYIPQKFPEIKFSSSALHAVKVKIPDFKIEPPAKCVVKIWPQTGWQGEFGFDWMREGISGIVGDVDYKKIVGKYPPKKDPDYSSDPSIKIGDKAAEFGRLKQVYKTFTIASLQDKDKNPYENWISWLSLFPADEFPKGPNDAKLIANIELVENQPLSLKFECAKKDYAEFIEIKEELPNATGKHPITVKSKKACDEDIIFDIVNQTNDEKGKEKKIKVGQLGILKNDKSNRYVSKVVFVPVLTNINGIVKNISSVQTTSEENFLEKYLQQALSSLTVEIKKLDLTVDESFWGNIKNAFLSIFGLAEDFNDKWVIKDDMGTNVIANYRSDWSKIHDYLEEKFNEKHADLKDWYKVFFFDEPGGYYNKGSYIGLNGGAKDIPSKCVVLFNSHNNATTTHKLLHAMGLFHSFSNSGKFTYVKGETENIMDYSHQSKYGSKSRISTWKWQWDQLQSNFEKEK